MILFMALAFYSYIRFYKLRYLCAASSDSSLFLARTKRSTDPLRPHQRVHPTLVDLDDLDGRLPLLDDLVQDGRPVCVLVRRDGGRGRPLEPPRCQAWSHDRTLRC